jgi:hypothetical protein
MPRLEYAGRGTVYSSAKMNAREYHESRRRLRFVASQADLTPDKVQLLLEPFVEQWRPVAVPNLKDGPVAMDPDLALSPPALVDLTARIRAIGMNLNQSGLKGVNYHNALQRHVAALAATFDCRGWTESAALFDDPEAAAEEPPVQLTGRVDVIWARRRLPVAVFEIDSTVKERSFQKLKEAAAAHKVWVYFGTDVWGFRTFLQKNDPEKRILAVIVPRTFVPSFED